MGRCLLQCCENPRRFDNIFCPIITPRDLCWIPETEFVTMIRSMHVSSMAPTIQSFCIISKEKKKKEHFFTIWAAQPRFSMTWTPHVALDINVHIWDIHKIIHGPHYIASYEHSYKLYHFKNSCTLETCYQKKSAHWKPIDSPHI